MKSETMRGRVKRGLCGALLALAMAGIGPGSLQAQDFPSRPVKLIVGFPPGAMADTIGRTLSEKLPSIWNQPVVVENRPGATGTIAADLVAKAAPDGHTLLVILTNHVILPAMRSLPFDSINDFAAVSLVGSSPLVLMAGSRLQANTLAELIEQAKARPGAISYSTPGEGSVHHLSMELLNSIMGVKMIPVPYQGGVPAMTDAIAGVVDFNIGSPAQALQQIESGKLRPIAYTGLQRSTLLPKVPTIAESGMAGTAGFSAALWGGVIAPAKTPRPVIDRIQQGIAQVMNLPEVRDKMSRIGVEVVAGSPEAFERYLREELQRWGDVARKAGVKGG